MKKKMTLRDFSQQIGISPGTVSKALQVGTKYRISPEKVTYIREQAAKRGFDLGTGKIANPGKNLRIGLICGAMLQYVGCHFYDGANNVCNQEGATLLLECCNHDVALEKKAFRHMCSEGVDALIYWPAAKPIKDFYSRSLNKLERAVLERIPCVVIGNQAAIANAYRIKYHTEEAGREAALRQLQMGCRNFAVLRFNLTWQDDREAENAYRNTLNEHGIPSRNIKIMKIGMSEPPERFVCFKNTDGVWLNHLFLLYRYLPYIQNYVDLKHLHVDGIGFQEFYRSVRQVCSALVEKLNMGEFFSDICASSGIKFCNLHNLGAQAAAKALTLSALSKEHWNGSEYCEWLTEENEKKLFPPLLQVSHK